MRLFDAHNHLQDARLAESIDTVISTLREVGVARCVVNGICEADWPDVLALAQRFPDLILPACGLHPWHIGRRSSDWQAALLRHLDGGAVVGEIGLDRSVRTRDDTAQQEVLRWQLTVAAERNLPVSIHCVQAWGRLLEILQSQPLPECGFLLHSYGGSVEMVPQFVKLGGFFSFSGSITQPHQQHKQMVVGEIPSHRLLIETDAPDMLPRSGYIDFPLMKGASAVNHPANIAALYCYIARLRAVSVSTLAEQMASNFSQLFGKVH